MAELTTLLAQDEPEEHAQPDYEALVIRYIRACRKEAEDARRSRIRRNEWNLDAYHGRQDWSHKLSGQSQEFLPKISLAVEQFCAFVKRAMTDFGDWGTLDYAGQLPQGVDAADLWRLLSAQLNSLSYTPEEALDFPTLVADGLKVGALESLMIFKIHGRMLTQPRFVVERGVQVLETPRGPMPQIVPELRQRQDSAWHLAIDLVQPSDWYPDPTGRGLYQIHRVERDLWEVQALAEGPDPIYDPEVVAQIRGDHAREQMDKRREDDRGQDEATAPNFRKRVVLDEFWGTILDDDGRVIDTNVVATLANEQYLIRVPEPNPAWHQQSPFVACPLRRLPFSVWHKALFDDAVDLNLALNELYNLILDGGISAVWGINQIRLDWLDNPRQVQDGVPQGTTLHVKAEVPPGAKVFEQVATGQVPAEALNTFTLTDREFQVAALTNDLKLGQLPQKSVKATEIVEAQQGQAGLIDGIIRDVEDRGIEPVLRKAWLLCVQHLSQMPADEVVATLGLRQALALSRLSPAERFTSLASGFSLKVNGLSAVLARVRDFQKTLALLQASSSNPLLMQAFSQRYSADKILSRLFKSLNIDPAALEADDQEKTQMQQLLPQMLGQRGPGGPQGVPEVPALQEGAEVPGDELLGVQAR